MDSEGAPQKRTGRTVVRPDARSRLVERDHWLLDALATMRFLTTSQVATLFFGDSRSGANKRLRTLFNAGLVRVWMRSLSQENVYSITRAGLHVRTEGDADENRHHYVARRLDGNLDHLLAINQVRIALALHLPDVAGDLSWWRSDWELHVHSQQRLIPDALFAVRWDGGPEERFSLELDHRKKSPRAFLRKILAYAGMMHRRTDVHGVRDLMAVLAVGHDPRWVESYRAAAAHVALPVPAWFATLDDINAAPTGAVWRSAYADDRHSLRELCSRRYRTEGCEAKDDAISDAYASGAARIWP